MSTWRGVAAGLGGWLSALALGSLLGSRDLGRPQQILSPPYVSQVPPGLLLVLLLTAAAVAAVSGVLLWRLRAARGRALPAVLVVLALATAAASWSALYLASLEDSVIPIFDWLFTAVPVALAGVLALRGRPLLAALLVAWPVAAVSGFYWAAYDSSATGGFLAAATLQGFGLILGLIPGLVIEFRRGRGRPEPRSELRSQLRSEAG